ncbi:MAG: nickel-responsive transcriptional regulator NikR [Desulfofustis sp.]|jgi:CopG family nickel-responsive transcriptional regulator|uniref:Putative nickel-responsive regulator n=1 Tax=Desulfofustis glycolicus DSM 9705 TaxID=1121409 RepID=A0A1M5WKT3_9BACT|nr:nickel-responsive transcriptional regulator NikR [Desulfofustis glycolicus]MBE0584884.1 nickel-responsive transcriptional regulator NikR [Desulfofustis sp.]MCB2217134.1 nickel-responsive transcriptional regulator NikR [Desulfobulbaceae bacterium]MEE4313237.1 nickel-responsive transcriptional regulator NikR [Desulfofustis sp.]SHH88176.1 transcriptional regulator, CopG family [Desulfofustis glycolicus DSM 9705]
MLKRFTISLDEKLLDDFDDYIRQQKYVNRSEAIRDLIRSSFVAKEWQADKDVVGVITMVYDHHQHQLQEKVTEIQHDYHHQIVSATHVHMDHHNCLEVIIIKGKAGAVNELADRIRSLRGVRNCNLAMSTTGKDLH